jgi:excisionase family DNA binding protein
MSQIAYSTADACRQLGVSRRTLSNMIRDGRLVARKLGRKTLIDGAALEACWKRLPLVEGPAPINSPPQKFPPGTETYPDIARRRGRKV